jgi:parallel beta-helix repeat protein
VISGNNYGVVVMSGNSGTIIRGNRIGTDPSGTVAVANHSGIYSASAVNVGNSETPGNNIISGNTNWGISIGGSSGSTVYGNQIGVGAASTSLPNQNGVELSNASATFGGNWIGFNTSNGIHLDLYSTLSADSTMNCFNGNGSYAVQNGNSSQDAAFTQNWWGSRTGPTHWGNPGGTGDHVTDNVTYLPFLIKRPAACSHTLTDFDGDGTADLGYFHPETGLWGILRSAYEFDYGNPVFFSWGTTGDIAVSGDYDGDGKSDPTVRRPPAGGQSAAYRMLLSSTDYNYGSTLTVPAGWPGLGDTPVPGDYYGDGKSDPAIWRGNAGVWIIPLSPTFGSYQFYSWGVTGDTPIGADVDADGKTDIGYWHPSTGVWGFLQSSQGYSYASPLFFSWGTSADIPVMADYDGDGFDDPAVVIPPAGGQSRAYRVLLSSMIYNPASSLTIPAGWPGLGDTPAPADYDGDGKADPAIWRGNTGVWIVPLSSGNYSTYLFRAWGASGDQVVK